MKLIDKDVIITEIEKLKGQLLRGACSSQVSMQTRCKEESYDEVLSFLDILEVKEVDIEKEVIDWWNAHYSSKAYTFEGYTGHYVENSTLIEIAKHFFELGMTVSKV